MAGRNNNITYTPEYIYSKYVELVEPRIDEIELWMFEGKTFSEIADELGVSNSLLWKMRISKTFTDLRDVFKRKTLMNENVEDALYRKAVGYFVEEEQAIKVKREYYNKYEKKCTSEDVKIVKVKKYIAPDFNAQRFFLLNKMEESYHPENAKAEDNTIDLLLDSARNVLVKVRQTAVSNQEVIEDGTSEDN